MNTLTFLLLLVIIIGGAFYTAWDLLRIGDDD
jgi:hypothetical protein